MSCARDSPVKPNAPSLISRIRSCRLTMRRSTLRQKIQQARVAANGCADGKNVLRSPRSKPTNGHERHAKGPDGATTLVLRVQQRGARIFDRKLVAAGVHTWRQQQ